MNKLRTSFVACLFALLCSSATTTLIAEDVMYVARTEHEFFYADEIVIEYLQDTMGLSVYVLNQDDLDMEADTVGIDLIILSCTMAGSATGSYTNVPIPIVTWEGWGFDDLGMCYWENIGDSQTAEIEDTETVQIVNSDHPLAAGLSDEVFITTENMKTSYHYGKAAGDGQTIATAPNGMDAIFAYEIYDEMYYSEDSEPFLAPERRVGLFWFLDTPEKLNDNGWALFAAAVNWSMGVDTAVKDKSANTLLPRQFELQQNYPNPFNPVTKISYTLDQQQLVQLDVYNLLGHRIASLVNKVQSAGEHQISFDGSNLPAGHYFYKLQTETGMLVQKMTLLK
jgi:hypothetical protein